MFERFDIHVFGDYFRPELFWILWTSRYGASIDMRRFRYTTNNRSDVVDVRHFGTQCFFHQYISTLASFYLIIYYAEFGLSCEESWIVIWTDLELELI